MATKTKQPAAPKQWTVLVYLAGDNDLDEFGTGDLREMKRVGSTDQVNVVAQFDCAGEGKQTCRYLLRKGTTLKKDLLAELGETNTGDPQTLEEFIKWGVTTYPAEHYLLVLWNHGAGVDDEGVAQILNRSLGMNVTRRGQIIRRAKGKARGSVPSSQVRSVARRNFRRALFSTTIASAAQRRAILIDDNARDFLDNAELKRVLAAAKDAVGRKIDVLGMDACLMNLAEVAYQVRDCADYTVGSEELEPGEGWPYDRVLAELVRKPQMSPRDLTKVIVKHYLASYRASENVTQSALDLSHAEPLARALDKLAQTLKAQLADVGVRTALTQARNQVREYDTPDYIDLVDLCQLLQAGTTKAEIKAACQAVIDAARQFIVSSGSKGAAVTNSNGASIYFPTRRLSPVYRQLDFAKKTAWDEFLQSYLEVTRGRAAR